MSNARVLLAQIEALTIDPPGARLRFVDRLARQNGWDTAYAARVLAEYRRFIALAATAPHPVTPSDEVDQAWHLHLAYTRSYWDDLCGDLLGRPLHHGPTAGGDAEAARYQQQYATTLEAYRAAFGEAAPADIWPPVDRRFASRFVRVDRMRHWLLPKRPSLAVVAMPLLAGCVVLAAAKAEDGESSSTIIIIIGVILLLAIISLVNDKRKRADSKRDSGCGGGGCGSSDNSGDSGCGGGGCGGD